MGNAFELGQWRYIAGLASWTQSASGGPSGQVWRQSCLPGQELHTGSRGCVNLLKQQNHIWCSSCNQRPHLLKLTIIYCHSPRSTCLLQRPNKSIEGGMWQTHHSCIIQVPQCVTNLYSTSRDSVPLWLTAFLGWRQFWWLPFHITFPTLTALTP